MSTLWLLTLRKGNTASTYVVAATEDEVAHLHDRLNAPDEDVTVWPVEVVPIAVVWEAAGFAE